MDKSHIKQIFGSRVDAQTIDTQSKAASEQAAKQAVKQAAQKPKESAAPAAAVAAPAEVAAVDPEVEKKVQLLLEVGEECQTPPELRNLVAKKPEFCLYDGFEPSGRMHIAQGVFKAINVNKCTQAGGIFKFWVADWFALMNDKMGGDLEKIQVVGKYLIEVWNATGMDMSRVKFLWCADEIEKNAQAYWNQMLDITRLCDLRRIKKCCQIMGRGEDKLTAAQILYPIMQCTDIFYLKADICQLGVDQRKVNMLARDYCTDRKIKNKPIILSHHMLYGLVAGQAKMSKSNPDSAVFMEDSAADVERKIMKAYCPLKPENEEAHDNSMVVGEVDTLKNPILDYVKFIVLSKAGSTLTIDGVKYTSPEAVKTAWMAGKIQEKNLKKAVIDALNVMLQGVREHFSKGEPKKLLETVQGYKNANAEEEAKKLKARGVLCSKVGDLPAGSKRAVVFAPRPKVGTYQLTVDTVVEVLAALKRASEVSVSGKKGSVILWCEDWATFALNRYGEYEVDKKGQPKEHGVRDGWYNLLVESLEALAPALMADVVEVKYQKDEILKSPNNYWISVINVGRCHSLEQIRGALETGEDLEQSSQVVAALMHVADCMALCNIGRNDKEALYVVAGGKEAAKKSTLALTYMTSECAHDSKLAFLNVHADDLCPSAAEKLDLTVGEGDNFQNTKIKKSYCSDTGDIERNPCLHMLKCLEAAKLLPATLNVILNIQNEDGSREQQEKSFKSVAEVAEAFKALVLHPSDFKPVVKDLIATTLLKPLTAKQKASKTFLNSAKLLENYNKKASKK